MEGFLDINSSQCYKESLKQTMLNQEITFKNQVHELHRLYTVQKSLMKGDSIYERSEDFPMKRTLSGNHSVGSTQFLIDSLFSQEDQDFCSRIHQIPLDLRLSTGYSSDDDGVLNEEVNLSLSIGNSTNNKRSRSVENSWRNKIVPRDVIDLEEWSSFNQESKEWHDVKQTKLVDLDLNKDQPDEAFHSNEPSSDLTEENEIKLSKVKEENNKDSDYAIQKAAHSLVSISLQQTSTSNQDSESKSGSNETENKKTTPRRSSSIDSYESLVLKLEESKRDEDCVTSKVFEINETDKKENGIKLRRGRRLKDFQKDILPTLSSLSRDEIWEDVKILEGVIRSREYKRLQKGKTGNGESSFTPVKCKRSKVGSLRKKK